MVVLFPGTKDQSRRWQTTNQDYGRFYLALSSEALGVHCRHNELHAECNKKCEALSRQLYELKSELERLRIGERIHSSRQGCRSPSNHNGDCDFAARARVPCDDMFHTTHDIDYNGGCRTEPQILDDHLKADHPRLTRKVQPVNRLGTSCFQKESGRNGETALDRGHTEARHPPPSGSYQSETTYSSTHVKQEYHSSRTPDSAGGGSYAEGSAGGVSVSASASEVVVAGAGGAGGGGGNPVKDSPPRGLRVKDSPRGGQRVRESPRAGPRVRASPRARDTPRDTASDAGTTTTSRRIETKVSKVPKATRSATAPKERMSPAAGPAAVGGNDGGGVAKQGVAGEGLVSRNQGGGGGSYPASQGGSEPRYAASRDRDVVVHSPHASLKAGGPQKKILPPSQRYNFYRYFGFAGQGAKTSRGWNPK